MCHVSRAIESEFDGVVLATEMEQYAIVAPSREMSSGLQLIEAVQKRPKTRSIPPRGSGVYFPFTVRTSPGTERNKCLVMALSLFSPLRAIDSAAF